MYTNITTNHVLEVIATFLESHPFALGLPANTLIAVLELVM
jgi:hypothetical protein